MLSVLELLPEMERARHGYKWLQMVTNGYKPITSLHSDARPNLAPTPLYNLLTNENLALPGRDSVTNGRRPEPLLSIKGCTQH